MNKPPTILLDHGGYPTKEYIDYIWMYTSETMSIIDFVETILQEGWNTEYGKFKLSKKNKNIMELELSTGGWSGNEEIINAILGNIYFTHYKMTYVQWNIGGHYCFEISV